MGLEDKKNGWLVSLGPATRQGCDQKTNQANREQAHDSQPALQSYSATFGGQISAGDWRR